MFNLKYFRVSDLGILIVARGRIPEMRNHEVIN
jgi:hypothetical protein